jgi:hypothetical protein
VIVSVALIEASDVSDAKVVISMTIIRMSLVRKPATVIVGLFPSTQSKYRSCPMQFVNWRTLGTPLLIGSGTTGALFGDAIDSS